MLTGDEHDEQPPEGPRPPAERRTELDAAGSPAEVLFVDGVSYPARSPWARSLDDVVADGRRRGRRVGRRPR